MGGPTPDAVHVMLMSKWTPNRQEDDTCLPCRFSLAYPQSVGFFLELLTCLIGHWFEANKRGHDCTARIFVRFWANLTGQFCTLELR